jgi:tetratricopeptide (TPR) repeat protein
MPLTDEYRHHLDNAYQRRSLNDRNGSLREFQRAAECDPSSVVAIQEMGYDYLALKQLDEAKSAFEKALALRPDHLGALVGLGHTFRHLQQLEDAEREFRRALAISPNHAGANLGLGYALKSRRDLQGALGAFRATLAADPQQTTAKNEVVNLLRDLGRLDEAIVVQRELIARQPRDVPQRLSLATLLRKNGELEEALSQFDSALAEEPTNHNARIEMGHLLRDMDRLADAEEMLKSVLSHSPNDMSALNALGWVYRKLRQPGDAGACFNKMLELQPNNIGALHALGSLAREQQEPARALVYFRRAAEVAPEDFNVRIEVGNCLQQARQFEEAAFEFERVLQLQPNSRAAMMGLGYALRDADKLDRALLSFDTASAIDSDFANAPIEAGHTLLRQGKASEAEKRFRIALTRDPANASGLVGLSYALRRLGRTTEAETALRLALLDHPANVGAAIALGDLLESMHKFNDAAEILGGIIERHPTHAGALTALANIHRRRRDRAAAMRYLQRALEVDYSASRLVDLAIELRELGQLDEAGRAISAALEMNPFDLKAMMERGRLLRLKNLREEAYRAFLELHRAYPANAQALVELATEERALGSLHDAEQTLNRALETEPDQLNALLQLGEIAMLRDDAGAAQRLFQRAMAAHSGNVWPRLNLARVYFDTGDVAAAFSLLRQTRQVFQSSPEIDAVEIDMLRENRDLKRAREVLEQSSRSNDVSSFWLWTHRVQIEVSTGNYDDANAVLARIPARSAPELARVELLRGQLAEAQMIHQEAAACYNRAIGLTPTDGWAHMDLARASLLNLDMKTARTALTNFVKLSRSYLMAKGRSLNISQNLVGQLLEDFELDPAVEQLRTAKTMPIETRIERLKAAIQENPNSTAAALQITIELRRNGYLRSITPRESTPNVSIPRTIVQYWDQRPDEDLVALMGAWQTSNADFNWRCFDRVQALGFLERRFPKSVVQAYRRAREPAQKADLFRLAYLTACGGVYADADDRCDTPLHTFMGSDATLVAHQDNLGSIGNNFLAATAEHPVMHRALSLAVEAINRGDQDLAWLSTGPGLLTRAFALEWASRSETGWFARAQIMSLGEIQRVMGIHCLARYKKTDRHWKRSSFRVANRK